MCGVAMFMVSWLLLMIVVTEGGASLHCSSAGLNHSYRARQSTLCSREDSTN